MGFQEYGEGWQLWLHARFLPLCRKGAQNTKRISSFISQCPVSSTFMSRITKTHERSFSLRTGFQLVFNLKSVGIHAVGTITQNRFHGCPLISL